MVKEDNNKIALVIGLVSGCISRCSRNCCVCKLYHSMSNLPIFLAAKAGSSGSTSSSGSSPGPSASPAKVGQGSSLSAQLSDPQHKDCLLREFRKLCAIVAENSSYNAKTQIIEKFLRKGSGGGKLLAVWL